MYRTPGEYDYPIDSIGFVATKLALTGLRLCSWCGGVLANLADQ
jgi:hypothetical protein